MKAFFCLTFQWDYIITGANHAIKLSLVIHEVQQMAGAGTKFNVL